MYNKYFFLHVPKAAGTSLFKVFDDILGNENVILVESINKGAKQMEMLDQYKLVGGHFTYLDYLELINKERYSITFLRNPVDRFLSQYFYYKNTVVDSKQPTVVNAQKLDLEDYIEYYRDKQIYGEVFNRQLWYLAGYQSPELTKNQVLEIAKENLSKINFVGIHEEFADSIDLMCYDCNWPLVKDIPMVNVTSKKSNYAEIDKNILEKIKELNDLDFQLYEYAFKLFDDKKRKILHNAIETNYRIFNSDSEEISNFKRNITNETENLLAQDKNISTENKLHFNMNCGSGEIKILSARIYNNINGDIAIESGGEAFIEVIFKSEINAENVVLGFEIEDQFGQTIYGTNSLLLNQRISVEKDGTYCVIYSLYMNIAEGRYLLNVVLHSDKCYSLSSELENGFHKFLNLNPDECYHYVRKINEFRVDGIKGTTFRGIAKLEPSFTSSKIQIIDKGDKETIEKISLKIREIPSEVEPKSAFYCTIDMMNCTSKIINSIGDNPINISYHWFNENGDKIVIFDGERSRISPSLLPFDHREYKVKIISPQEQGTYKLRITLVQEGVAWLDELNTCLSEDTIIHIIKSKDFIDSNMNKIMKKIRNIVRN